MTATRINVAGNVVDIAGRLTYAAEVVVENGHIAAITESGARPTTYLLPGFIDAHVHVESSMLVPSEFARAAVVHGTVATVSDPHEIGNVLGVAGVRYMLENAAKVPFKFNFGAPSCVPATTFETAGAEITVSGHGSRKAFARRGRATTGCRSAGGRSFVFGMDSDGISKV